MKDLVTIGGMEEMKMMEEVREVEVKQEKVVKGTVSFRWDKFLPVAGIRVLLVEADDSTRQFISAILRNCNYKVVAVSDGLEAWKILKRKYSSIDLILMEVDIPSISGYALLSLIMEHDGCRHIPVVMMSCEDSMNMVFKCMSHGAADFLTKPLRRNELKNLWQHVWRKRNVKSENEPHGIISLQGKEEAAAENNAENNPCSESSDNASANKKRLSNKKPSDAHNSHIAQCLEAENGCKESAQGLAQQRKEETDSNHKTMKLKHETSETQESSRLRNDESCDEKMSIDDGAVPEGCKDKEAHSERPGSSTIAIDLIGRIDDPQRCMLKESSSEHETNRQSSNLQLELSLRGYQEVKDNQGMEDMIKLNHSNASAFSRYGNEKLGPRLLSSSSICTELNGGECEISTGPAPSDTSGLRIKSINITGQSPQTEAATAFKISHRGVVPLAFGGMCAGYGSAYPALYDTQVLPPDSNPNLALQKESSAFTASSSLQSDPGTLSSTPGCGQHEETRNPTQTVQENNVLASEKERHSTNARSGSSSVCNGFSGDQPNSTSVYRTLSEATKGSATETTVTRNGALGESMKDDGGDSDVFKHDQLVGAGPLHKAQREAALAKFRLKRKERCFDKKVRYQSRKKLAEQRPRVKGQFVRQT